MSDQPLGPEWWIASDGRWYPPDTGRRASETTGDMQMWDPRSSSWSTSRLTLGPDHLGLGEHGSEGGVAWISYSQLIDVTHLGAAPDGRHTVRVTYRTNGPAPAEVTLCLSNELQGTLVTEWERHRHHVLQPPNPSIPPPGQPTWGQSTPAPTRGPATARRPEQTYRTSGLGGSVAAVLLGAALLVLGALLPWMTVDAAFVSLSINGVDGDGVITLGIGLLVGILMALGRHRRLPAFFCLLLGGLAGFVAIYDMVSVSDGISEIEQAQFAITAHASIGVGLWVTAIGAVLVMLGSLVTMTSSR